MVKKLFDICGSTVDVTKIICISPMQDSGELQWYRVHFAAQYYIDVYDDEYSRDRLIENWSAAVEN